MLKKECLSKNGQISWVAEMVFCVHVSAPTSKDEYIWFDMKMNASRKPWMAVELSFPSANSG